MDWFKKFLKSVLVVLRGERLETLEEDKVPLYEVGEPVRVLPSDNIAKRYWNRKGIVMETGFDMAHTFYYYLEMRNKGTCLLVYEHGLEKI